MRKHKEAFCHMTYRCKDCGFEERIWNSRDGVTPFCIACPSCKGHNHIHQDWQNDRYDQLFSLSIQPGKRMFVTMTMTRAREYAALRVDRMIETGELEANRRNYVIGEVAKNFFHEGNAPDIVTYYAGYQFNQETWNGI